MNGGSTSGYRGLRLVEPYSSVWHVLILKSTNQLRDAAMCSVFSNQKGALHGVKEHFIEGFTDGMSDEQIEARWTEEWTMDNYKDKIPEGWYCLISELVTDDSVDTSMFRS